MKAQRYDGGEERRLMTGMVVDSHLLAVVAEKWGREGLFSSRWANIVGRWCVDFYRKYRKAPGHDIEALFDDWSASVKDKDTAKLVEQFLSSLSGEYVRLKKRSQTDYLVDLAGKYFTKIRLRQLSEEINARLENGDVDGAVAAKDKFSRVDVGVGTGVDVLEDMVAMKRAFEQKAEPLIKYPGALGTFFGDSLERDGFISFEAPEKRGKTWMIMDVAWQGMMQGRRCAFFEVGDLSEAQALRRFAVRASRIPLEKCEYKFPISIQPAGEEKYTTCTSEDRKAAEFLTWAQVERACKKLTAKRSGGSLLKLATYPMSTISITGVMGVIEKWERDGWVPDVVVIDYADILAPVDGRDESREQVNKTWKGMRTISQTRHCLMVTATQTDADSYDTDIIDMSNYSEDKRKRAHVTGSVGINQTDDEKDMGITRLNWIVRREWAYSKKRCVHVAGCLALARPCILSTF